jgi:hypothetical protein
MNGALYKPNNTDGVGVEIQGTGGGTGGNKPLWWERPFHPRQGGTGAIKDLVIAQAKFDKLPGVVGS